MDSQAGLAALTWPSVSSGIIPQCLADTPARTATIETQHDSMK